MLVCFNDHQRVAATLVPPHAHVGDVDAELAQNGGHGGFGGIVIQIANHQRVVGAGEIHVDAVQFIHHNAAAA